MLDYNFCLTAMLTEDTAEDEQKPAMIAGTSAQPEALEAVAKKMELDLESTENTVASMQGSVSRGASMFGGSWKESSPAEESYDDLFSMEEETECKGIPSAEILVAIATDKKHVFRSFRGLVDTGTSASLMDRALVPADVHWLEKGKQS